MSYILIVLRLRRQAVLLLTLVTALGFASGAAAALVDLNVPNGNFNVAGSWIDHSTSASGVPTDFDAALVRNGGTLNVTAADGNAIAVRYRIGVGPVTASDEGADPTPPPTYGGSGTLNWTGGDMPGGVFGSRMQVGERDNTNDINYTGIVNQSGGKLALDTVLSYLTIGSTGTTPTPTSIYNLSGGTIGLTAATNSNNGINVRNGTFNMTGGQIISDDNPATPQNSQRAMNISTASGALGTENVAYANFSGGTVYTYGGLHMGNSANSKAYVTISGTADLHFRAVDMTLAANATNSYGKVDMSGGSLKVGDNSISQDRRLIIGDSGTGVFNLSGGTVNINHSLVVGNNSTSNGLLYQTGGSLTVRDVETNRNSGLWDLTTENAAIIIDGPNAVFTQQNTSPTQTGEMTLGRVGKGRLEIRQGQANIREIDISDTAQSRATLNLLGGKLKIQDGIIRNNVTNDATNNNTPTLNFTAGELELTPVAPTPNAMSWNVDLPLRGSAFDPKPGALMLTNVGSFPSKPANFSLNSGSVWDLNIAGGTEFDADVVDVPNGSGALNGGTLNILPIGSYTPANGDMVRILHGLNGVTMNAAAVTVSDPHWQLQMDASNTIVYLKYVASASIPGDYNNNGTVDAADYALWRKNPSAYGGTPAGYITWRTNFGKPPGSGSSLMGSTVPEPTSIVLVGLFASALLTWRRGSRRVEC